MNPMITSDLDLNGVGLEQDFDEKQDVTNIDLDDASDEQQEEMPPVTDHQAILKKYLPEIPDLETADSAVFTWNITNWKQLEKKVHSPVFQCGGHPWKILFFPYGNQADHASFYLEHGYGEGEAPESWSACVQFLLVLSNPNNPSIYIQNSAKHRFQAEEGDWGFTRFVELRKLFSQPMTKEGQYLLEDGGATLTAFVRVVKDPTGVLWHNFVNYDSKKETGMVGLKNQGATCYLNSLLQSLYFTNEFRKAIYQIPTEAETDIKANSAYALQRLFYNLQLSDSAVSTNELTTSFGWESRQVFEQQDVQELSRVLMDRMETRMKGTEAEDTLSKLFVGSMKTFIRCINVDYESARTEDFWDLQLNVRGNKTLDDSFKDYIQVETLEGDNKYHADKFGLQDAKKGVIFEKFPQVLHLQLKRFEYDFMHDTMMKVYDRYEFPEVWDASPYLSEDADRSESYIYHLHGVLVHSGDLNAGHYYAFLKPTKGGDFFKFDDDRVTRATRKEAMDENFGGEFDQANGFSGQQRNPYTRTWTKQRYMSAYMLVYIRESRQDSVLADLTEKEIPAHLSRKIQEEKAELERRRKEREEAHLYMQVSVSTDNNFKAWQGFDLFPRNDQNVPAEAVPKVHRLLRSTTLTDFRKMIADDLNLDAELVRPWSVVGRQNATIRPDTPLDANSPTIEEALIKVQNKAPFRLWIEILKRNADGKPEIVERVVSSPGQQAAKPVLLFLKHFDTEKQTLTGSGHVYVSSQGKVSDMISQILENMGWPTGTELKFWEEIKHNMIEPVSPKVTIGQAELQDGDIICFQRALPDSELKTIAQAGNYTDPPRFYDYLLNKVTIYFKDRANLDSDEGTFSLELSKRMMYDQLAAKVAEYLKVQPDHLRFSGVTASTGKPRTYIKRTANSTLAAILTPPYSGYTTSMSMPSPDSLFYEVLELSLTELESKKTVRVNVLSEGITKDDIVEVLVPKTGSVGDLVDGLQKKLKLSEEDLHSLRLIEAHQSKVYRELKTDMSLSTINEFVTIYAEKIPEEERQANPDTDRAVYAFHFDKEPVRVHDVPFKFIVKEGEVFADTKERLSKRTGIKGKQLEKVKFAIVSRSNFLKPEYLSDDDILSERLVSGEDQLGLDHMNKNRNIIRNDAMMIR